MPTHWKSDPCTAIEPRIAQINFTHINVSNERWTNRRWKPTVMPNAVNTYIPTSKPKSVQPKPQPQTKNGAAITPSSGITMARTVTSWTVHDAFSEGCSRGG